MDYSAVFGISAWGMSVDQLRLNVTALNLANANTTAGPNTALYHPMRVVAQPYFPAVLSRFDGTGSVSAAEGSIGQPRTTVEQTNAAPRLVYDPGHPDANAQGYVRYPGINPVSEMVNLISVTRSYEANVRAMNAAKTMALKALDIGSGK